MSVTEFDKAPRLSLSRRASADAEIRSSRLRRRRAVVLALTSRPGLVIALAYLAIVLLAAAAPGLLSHHDPYATAPLQKSARPALRTGSAPTRWGVISMRG